ncbi:hypothetical protein FJT64_023591 [Amphibalanus amphitrite]|uniref:Uncharacterized protein n=1 Tax=Amphibalanus amphitrite TaxID=1232801 RepID=A0A6A4WPN2_AMPAM|nr:hypothetical protein FJT64_023591 [Amphibalanus amphitrite]
MHSLQGSDSEVPTGKQLIGKRKDKKDKDIGYAALGESSGDDDEDGSARKKKKGEPADASEQAHLSESCVENDQSLCSVDLAGDFTYRLVGVVQLNGGAKHSGYYLCAHAV